MVLLDVCAYPDVEITITPKEGYVITSITSWKYLYDNWIPEYIDIADPEGSVTLEKNMYCDRKISAKFKKKDITCYTATALASPPEGGTATVNDEPSVTVAAGEEVLFVAEPNDGYVFLGWYEDVDGEPVSTENSFSLSIDKNTTLTAVFEKDEEDEKETHQVTIDIIGEGTATGAGTYDHGAHLNITATPDSGWHFDNWYYEGDTLNPDGYPVTTDMAITAKFVKDQGSDPKPKPSSGSSSSRVTKYTLDVSVHGAGSVLPEEGKHTYTDGTTVALVPTPDSGAIFIGWFGEDADDIVDNAILMDEDKSIIARFSSADKELPPTPEPEPLPEEDVILDDEIPISSPILPQTAGIPLELLLASGTLMVTGGIAVRRKKNKH